jgi:hypothetical protein
MELILSNLLPAKFSHLKTTRKYFESCLAKSDHVKIATGYISSESLNELKRIVEINHRPKLDILIGMHFFDGFTRNQYNSAKKLHELLKTREAGGLYLSNKVEFHGKMYSFHKDSTPFACMVGSSNLGSVMDSGQRRYEADILFENETEVINIDICISELIQKLGTSFEEVPIINFIERNQLLANHQRVKKLEGSELKNIWDSLRSPSFEIELKTEPKSNLNVFFGKGRVGKNGFEKPRSWYEVEIIVSKNTTEKEGYPSEHSFDVITDDGWQFRCKTGGDFSKNFRSEDDLLILGKWIKGRLEEFGALTIGDPVTDDVLQKYGRNAMRLSATVNPDIWLLNFEPPYAL